MTDQDQFRREDMRWRRYIAFRRTAVAVLVPAVLLATWLMPGHAGTVFAVFAVLLALALIGPLFWMDRG